MVSIYKLLFRLICNSVVVRHLFSVCVMTMVVEWYPGKALAVVLLNKIYTIVLFYHYIIITFMSYA